MPPTISKLPTWRDFIFYRVRDHLALRRVVQRTYSHLFSSEDRRMFSHVGQESWPRMFDLLRNEIIIHMHPDRREPPAPNYGDPAAVVMRRIFAPAALLSPSAFGRNTR